MVTHRIALVQGWYRLVETGVDGTIAQFGSFRTHADAEDFLNFYLRTLGGTGVFSIAYAPARQNAANDPPNPGRQPS